ncbi:MarR family transcriptional regulator [Chitinasiproducens palmae]|uniref:Predicted nucleic acid-binding protein, contains PIN domain n=1 Tax=Chitinasiproducens palmae TaxID=1770053 RepID=A0A1H2PKT8_9BURK|nr:MarR family transcriptional regulator [Chitinasiproducens palmae]SDV46196.1 Predicted nucleic acid-binding protein, contains PIN domain [Chitinasiproducens palmae]
MAKTFVDSSVLLHLIDADSRKADLAEQIVREGVTVTPQVIADTIQALQGVLRMSWPDIDEFVQSIGVHTSLHQVSEATVAAACVVAKRTSLAYNDALLVAAAEHAGCRVLYSARLSNAVDTGVDVRVANPFLDTGAPTGARRSKGGGRKTPKARLALLYARPGFLLRRAHQISVAIFEGACGGVGITPGQLSVLTVLSARPGVDQATLSRAIGLDKVTTSHLVRALEARALLTRCPADGRRGVAVALTEAGEALLDRVDPCLDAGYQQLMSALDASDQMQLIALLNRLNARLDDRARTPFHPL